MLVDFTFLTKKLYFDCSKHTIVSERKFDFLKDLVSSVPDVQQADDDSGDGQPSNSHPESGTGRPRGR